MVCSNDRDPPRLPRRAELGATVYGRDGERIGTVSGLADTGENPQLVIDLHPDLGVGARTIMVPANELGFFQDSDGVIP